MPAPVYFKLSRDVSPLADHILVTNMEQGEKITRGGIILRDDNGKDHGIRPRWAQVYKVGKNVDYVEPGEWVLIEHGRWTYAVDVTFEEDGVEKDLKIQRIDTEAILLIQAEKPETV